MSNDPLTQEADGESRIGIMSRNESNNPELSQTGSTTNDMTIHGLKLWLLVAGLFMGIFLVGLDMTMLSTVAPKLTDFFGTVKDISWMETAYTLSVCVCIPLIGKMYTIFPNKYTYLTFLAIFDLGSMLCALSKSSNVFILGRAINGVGSAGVLSGALIIIFASCEPKIRPMVTSFAMSMISIGSITGPLIAGALTDKVSWQWCFWIFLPIGGATMLTTIFINIPEQMRKPAFSKAIIGMHLTLDLIGFVIFAGMITMFILAISWGGSSYVWNSGTIIGLLCGFVALTTVFGLWIVRLGDAALIPPASLCRQSVSVGSAVMFFQGGSTQMISYYLPYWFQAINGDSSIGSGVHMLASLISFIISLVAFGTLVRMCRFIPPWGIVGSVLASVGSGLLTTLSPTTTTGQITAYQTITSIGRGMSFQVPVVAIQECVPTEESATALAIANLMMNLGAAVGVSIGETIFRGSIASLLAKHAPDVDVVLVINTGATEIRKLVMPEELPGLLLAYNDALAKMFFYPTACSALAVFVSCGLSWKKIEGRGAKDPDLKRDISMNSLRQDGEVNSPSTRSAYSTWSEAREVREREAF